MRCAIYTRVSTRDKGQDVTNQLLQLREFASKQGWQIVAEYSDQASAKGTNGRHEFLRLFEDAAGGKFDVLLVWALDRLTREGILSTFRYLETLAACRVKLHSLTEPQFSTTGPAGELMLAVAAWIAKQERLRISERVKAGIARVRKPGDKWGAAPQFNRYTIRGLADKGLSHRAIAKQVGCSHQTVNRVLSAAD